MRVYRQRSRLAMAKVTLCALVSLGGCLVSARPSLSQHATSRQRFNIPWTTTTSCMARRGSLCREGGLVWKNKHSNFLTKRGGYSDYGGPPDAVPDPSSTSDYGVEQQPPPSGQVDPYQQQDDILYYPTHSNSQDYQDGFTPPINNDGSAPNDPFSETVQQRVDRWKTEQREQALLTTQNIPNSAAQNANLMATVSKGSRTILFFFLMWRDLHLFEMADQSLRNQHFLRTCLVTPLVFLFLFNLIGALTSLMQSQTEQHGRAKRRLKAILNADKLVEMALLAFNVLRLTILPSKYTAREVYVANIFHSMLFLLQCHAFTRLSWNDKDQPMLNTKPAATDDGDNDDDGSTGVYGYGNQPPQQQHRGYQQQQGYASSSQMQNQQRPYS